MKSKSSFFSDWLLWALTLILLIPTSYRTVQLMSLTLPPGDWWLGIFALVAFDVGTVGWALYHIHGAKSEEQEKLAILMVVICLLGVGASFIGDTVYQGTERGILGKSDIAPWAIAIQTGVVMAVIGAAIACKLMDPDARLHRKERRAFYTIQEKRIQYIEQHADAVASQVAASELENWTRNTLASWNVKQERSAQLPGQPAQSPRQNSLRPPLPLPPLFQPPSADGGSIPLDPGQEGSGNTKDFFPRRGQWRQP